MLTSALVLACQPPGGQVEYSAVNICYKLHCPVLQESELEGCTSLRHVLVGGEALPPVLASRFGQRLPNAHLHNAYGPTETTVDATGTSSSLHTLRYCNG